MKRIVWSIICIILIVLMMINCSNKNIYDFNTKSISLYQMIVQKDGDLEVYKFNKIVTITDRKKLKRVINHFSNFNFSELSEGEIANLVLDYYLVFDDTGMVLQFGDTDIDMGRIGTNLNVNYVGINGFNETDFMSCDLVKYEHIPLKAISFLNSYLNK